MTTRAALPVARTRAGAVLALVRWPNALIAAAGVLAGAWWAHPDAFLVGRVMWGVGAAIAAAASMNAVNDLFDVDIDRVAHPDRPLPRGAIAPRAALAMAVGAAMLAIALAQRAGGAALAMVAAAVLVGYLYSTTLKAWGLPGNLAVAATASLPFLVGGAAVGRLEAAMPLFAVAVPLHLAREIVKDVADVRGDVGRRRTLPVVVGSGVSRAVALGAVAVHAGLVSFLFAPFGWRRALFAPSIAVAAWATARADAGRAATLLKLAMLLAMAALPLAR